MWETEPYMLDLSDVVVLDDEALLKISAANPDLRIEQNAAGQLEIMPPAGPSSSIRGVKVDDRPRREAGPRLSGPPRRGGAAV